MPHAGRTRKQRADRHQRQQATGQAETEQLPSVEEILSFARFLVAATDGPAAAQARQGQTQAEVSAAATDSKPRETERRAANAGP